MPGCPSLTQGKKPDPYKCPDQVGTIRPAGTREALPGTSSKFEIRNWKFEKRKSKNWRQCNLPRQILELAVRQHLLNAGHIGRADRRQLLQLAHAAGGLEAGKVALGGVAAQNFAGRGDLEALAGAAMRLQLHFGF